MPFRTSDKVVKIDIFVLRDGSFKYYCSTDSSKTCKEAKQKFLQSHSGFENDEVKVSKVKAREEREGA